VRYFENLNYLLNILSREAISFLSPSQEMFYVKQSFVPCPGVFAENIWESLEKTAVMRTESAATRFHHSSKLILLQYIKRNEHLIDLALLPSLKVV
jgi:hypothetical protein